VINRKLSITNTLSNRNFGFIFSGIFALIVIYIVLFKNFIPTALIFTSCSFIISAVFFPNVLSPLNKFWFIFTGIVGSIISKIILSLIYLFTVIPIGIMLKIFGKDLLKIKKNENIKSYWIKKEKSNSSIKNQF